MSENTTLTVRLPKVEKDAFKQFCDAADLTSSQVVRAHIRECVSRLGEPDLFGGSKLKS